MRNFSQFKGGGGAWPKWPNGKYAYAHKDSLQSTYVSPQLSIDRLAAVGHMCSGG